MPKIAAATFSQGPLAQFIQSMPIAVAMFDLDMRYIAASDRWYADYRLKRDDIIGRSHYDIFPEIPERWKEIHRRNLAGEAMECDADPFPREDGTIDYVRWKNVPWREEDGAIGGLIMFTEVVTDAINDKIMLVETQEVLNFALQASSAGVFDWGETIGKRNYSNNVASMLGYTSEEWSDTLDSWLSKVNPEDMAALRANYDKQLTTDGSFDVTYRVRHASGEWRWWRSQGRSLLSAEHEQARLIGTHVDITDLVRAREQAERHAATLAEQNQTLRELRDREAWTAEHDTLTGLTNRRYLERNWGKFVHQAADARTGVAAIHVDLDRFKRVNDTLGHAAGDALLIEMVRRLRNVFSRDDLLIRFGGDEFLGIVQSDPAGAQAHRVAQDVLDAIKRPFELGGQEFRLGASIGIAAAHPHNAARERLIRQADAAMYAAKSEGRFRIKIYDAENARREREKRRLSDDLYRAIENREFRPFYQPQVSAVDFSLLGVEALARWAHPELGLLTPVKFISLAEDLGLVDQIDEQILKTAAEDVIALEERSETTIQLGVNFSLRRLSDLKLIERLGSVRQPKGGLAAEVLESIFLDDIDESLLWNIDQMKELGVKIELDDFGSGRTSVRSIVKLRPARIKIDRELTRDIDTSPEKAAIVRAIHEMASELGISVLAEGVETEQQALMLNTLGVDALQGHYFGMPAPLEKIEAMIADQKRTARAC